VKITYGPGRHPISTAVMVYFEGPDKLTYEYSCGVKYISPEEDRGHRPRQFSRAPLNGDMWGSGGLEGPLEVFEAKPPQIRVVS